MLGATRLGLGVVASVLVGCAPAGGATASSPRAQGVVTVAATSNGSASGRVVLTGAIGDSGTTLRVNATGKADARGGYIKLSLRQGTVEVNLRTLDTLLTRAVFLTPTCSATLSASSPASVVSGTGAYRGITGTITLTVTVSMVLPRYASGSHKGTCNVDGTSTGELVTFSGSGPISFSA